MNAVRDATRVAWPPLPRRVERTMDARHLNAVANHPEVRPWLGGDGELDLTAVLANPAHIAVVTPHGGYICLGLGEGRYDVHSMFLPEGRGDEAYQAMLALRDYMFAATDGVEGLTKVPLENRAAAVLARRAGFERRYAIQIAWTGGARLEGELYGLTFERWCLGAELTATLGAWLHAEFERVKMALAWPVPPHPHDAIHDRFAGMAVLLARHGHVRKAERYYNQWAQLAGYSPMRVLRDRPTILDLDGLIVELGPDDVEVLSCP